MAISDLDGGFFVHYGPNVSVVQTSPSTSTITMDATNEALINIGQVITSDRGSHTIDTTGSSALLWRTSTVTLNNGGTTFKVGLAPVDTGTGPPARASNASDVISFDVSADFTGGGGGVTTSAWQSSVPTTGTKTVAHGDFLAFAMQMTARGGADQVQAINQSTNSGAQRPTVTSFTGGSYVQVNHIPNCIIVFSDGALGWIYGGDVFSTLSTRTWNSTDTNKEYGQLYQIPAPVKIYGLYGWTDPDANFDVVLYSDPLGTPVAEETVSFDANAVGVNTPRMWRALFPTPYETTADQLIVAAIKPGASNISAYYKTLASATHRITQVAGTTGYGVLRDAGSFSDANSSLDHYYIGLVLGGLEVGGGGGGGGAHILGGTVVR